MKMLKRRYLQSYCRRSKEKNQPANFKTKGAFYSLLIEALLKIYSGFMENTIIHPLKLSLISRVQENKWPPGQK